MPWFWEHWDSSKMSAWFGDYNEDFAGMDFMNVNLIGGKTSVFPMTSIVCQGPTFNSSIPQLLALVLPGKDTKSINKVFWYHSPNSCATVNKVSSMFVYSCS